MEKFGSNPKVVFLYGPEVHKLHLEFEVAEKKDTVTFSADLSASNVVSGYINGVAITPITYGGSHDATMTALAASIAAHADVASATSTAGSKVITMVPVNNATLVYTFLVTGGSAVTAATAHTQSTIYPGQPVKLVGSGEKVTPLLATEPYRNAIGISLHKGEPGALITAVMKGFAVTNGQVAAGQSIVPGPVKVTGYDTATNCVTYTQAAADTDVAGWALDSGSAAAAIRVCVNS